MTLFLLRTANILPLRKLVDLLNKHGSLFKRILVFLNYKMKGAGVGYSSFERLSVFENENSERGQSHPKETMNFNHPSNATQEPQWKGTLGLKICPNFLEPMNLGKKVTYP